MKLNKPIFAALALLSSCGAAPPKTDFGQIPMCASLKDMPNRITVTDECDPALPTTKCTFYIPKDSFKVKYYIEEGLIREKVFEFETSTSKAPFSISKSDTLKSVSTKISKYTKKNISFRSIDDYGIVFKSKNTFKCGKDDSYNLYIEYNNDKTIESIYMSNLADM
jgi:hypothetical protein